MNEQPSGREAFLLVYNGLRITGVVSKSGAKMQNGVWCYLSAIYKEDNGSFLFLFPAYFCLPFQSSLFI